MATSHHADQQADEDDPVEPNAGCPECGDHICNDPDEAVCEACGLVLEEHRIDNGPECRTFGDPEESSERMGAPLTTSRYDRGLSTIIGRAPDAKGNPFSDGKRRQINWMRREQSRGRFSFEALASREPPTNPFVVLMAARWWYVHGRGTHDPVFQWAIEWTRNLATDNPPDVHRHDAFLDRLVEVGFSQDRRDLRSEME